MVVHSFCMLTQINSRIQSPSSCYNGIHHSCPLNVQCHLKNYSLIVRTKWYNYYFILTYKVYDDFSHYVNWNIKILLFVAVDEYFLALAIAKWWTLVRTVKGMEWVCLFQGSRYTTCQGLQFSLHFWLPLLAWKSFGHTIPRHLHILECLSQN